MDELDLLQKTSRTFALAIPLLPQPTQHTVTLAYLVMRLVDTFEDATSWSKAEKLRALSTVSEVLGLPPPAWREGGARLAQLAVGHAPTTHAGSLELLASSPALFEACAQLPERPRAIVARAVTSMAEGMARFVERTDAQGRLELASRAELHDYCYVVAGLVGELLTEVFLHDVPTLSPGQDTLRETMHAFGEGLQLVNIVKDADDDFTEGRRFLPPALSRAQAVELARGDLAAAARYVLALHQHQAPTGVMAFTGLALVLATRTLDALERGQQKLSRAQVAEAHADLSQALEGETSLQLLLAAAHHRSAATPRVHHRERGDAPAAPSSSPA